jgi:polyhydroxyalkanoate synthase
VAGVNQAVEAKVDPIGMATPLLHAQLAWLSHPQEMSEALTSFSAKMWDLQTHSWHRALGMPSKDVVLPNPDDTRFASPVWSESASWDIVKEWYLMLTHQVQDMLYDTPGLSSRDRRRAAFWWRKWLNAVAPTNFLLSNPEAMQKAMETRGESLLKGFNNFLTDFQAGDVQMARPTDFVVGRDLATTPGKVVFRNRLLEVIHYVPSREKVYKTPIVIVTPWINKFYILDLNAKKSMVKFLVDQGLDVYITSWKNPGADMRDVSFDDYLTDGIGKLVETAQGLSGSDKVHAVGYCIGGAALTAWMAWANAHYSKKDVPVASVTLLTTLVDYHKPGDIEVFLDENSIKWLEKSMAEKGYLDGKEMASAFRLLRSNSLVWHYVVRGYLFGEAPPPFDVLFLEHGRHSHAGKNAQLVSAQLLSGKPADQEGCAQPRRRGYRPRKDLAAALRRIRRGRPYSALAPDLSASTTLSPDRGATCCRRPDTYSGSSIRSSIRPSVISMSEAPERHDTPDEWRERAELRHGSWWEDWMEWIKPQSGYVLEQ